MTLALIGTEVLPIIADLDSADSRHTLPCEAPLSQGAERIVRHPVCVHFSDWQAFASLVTDVDTQNVSPY